MGNADEKAAEISVADSALDVMYEGLAGMSP